MVSPLWIIDLMIFVYYHNEKEPAMGLCFGLQARVGIA